MQIINLRKTGGARMKDAHTYTVSCLENNLIGYKTLKSANEVDPEDFVHVILSKLSKETKVIVKIHEANSMFAKNEVMAMKALKEYRNTVHYICDFVCQDNIDRWQEPVKDAQKFCLFSENLSSKSVNLHFIVMEYIPNGDLSHLLRHLQDTDVLTSLFLQTALVIIELGSIYKICHGDINSGNILITTTKKSTLSYSILGKPMKIKTFGHVPIFLDFGRCSLYEKITKNKYDILQDVLTAFSVYSGWMQPDLKVKVRDFVTNELAVNKRDLMKLIERVETMFV